ncbi:hypothetical protein [Streptoalloteichus hindustanus]|uniref:Zinc-finger n=1 Tax=Streptoalloteichus hindustanus TaxID=2017 RepID=A0A1M5NAY5_STRHI|nr:hypothetical protein [Streptoalloteichus hindustanus]SHG86657.1 hypothetical protein SAMN05444320_11562 [Streptoalloteichus hindustanus]
MSVYDFPGYTWLPFEGKRHAYPGAAKRDKEPVTLFCQLAASAWAYELGALERLWPECDICREMVGKVVDHRSALRERARDTFHVYGDRPPYGWISRHGAPPP